MTVKIETHFHTNSDSGENVKVFIFRFAGVCINRCATTLANHTDVYYLFQSHSYYQSMCVCVCVLVCVRLCIRKHLCL